MSAPAATVERVRSLKVDARYGRLYLTGPMAARALVMAGAAKNQKHEPHRPVVELSLTLQTLRKLKTVMRMSSQELAGACTENVMRWARAAADSEKRAEDAWERIAAGYRTPLPWHDARAGKPGPDGPYEYRPPFEHQRVMATIAAEISGVGFVCDMGTGKTRAAIEAAAHQIRERKIHGLVVVSPTTVMGTWEREARLWSRELIPYRLEGRVTERKKALTAVLSPRAQAGGVAILNYEVLDKMKDSILAAAAAARVGIIFDEGHRIRNPSAKVTKAAMKVAAQASWRALLGGTPVVNGIENIWSQWYVVDLGVAFGANFVQFRREFFRENEYTMSLDPLDDTASEVSKRIRRRGVRFKKEDCLDLPPKVYHTVEVEMGREQAEAYREMEQNLIVEFSKFNESEDGVASAAIQLTMLLRLAQITSGYLPNEEGGPVYRFPANPKLDALEEAIREHVGRGGQFIAWAAFRENYGMIRERIADLGHVEIVGGMTARERDEAERAFQAGEARVLIGNPASAGAGLNLQAASAAAYYSQGYNLDYRLQSEDRCHRSGSEVHRSIDYFDFFCRGTIDEVIRASQEEKHSVARAVTEFRRALGA